MPDLVRLRRQPGQPDILVVTGGVIPAQDGPGLREAGVADFFGPGTVIPVAALHLVELLDAAASG